MTQPGDASISVCYVTHRDTPRFEWFADSLAAQLGGGPDVEVVVVDGMASAARADEFTRAASGRFPMRYVPPKPTPMSGPHRVTTRDYMATSSARNTAAVYARGSYLVYTDDCSVVMPGWWAAVKRAAGLGWVVAGGYQKHWDMHVVDGQLVSSRTGGVDSRWDQGDPERPVRIGGGQLYGSSFGLPRQLLVAVNGLDELCDPVGGEDYQLGMRLEWAGAEIWYDRRMFTVESEDLHVQSPAPRRLDKSTDFDTYMQTLRGFGVERRTVEGNLDSSHLILDVMYGLKPARSLGNYYDLADLDEESLDACRERFPTHHWFDNQPLADL